MLVWRIARQIHGDTTLEGIGGLLVHVEPLQAPDDLRLLGLELPDGLAIETLDLTQLPRRLAEPTSTGEHPVHRQRLAGAKIQRGSAGAFRHRSDGKQCPAQSAPPRDGQGADQQQRGLPLRFQVALKGPEGFSPVGFSDWFLVGCTSANTARLQCRCGGGGHGCHPAAARLASPSVAAQQLGWRVQPLDADLRRLGRDETPFAPRWTTAYSTMTYRPRVLCREED
jgi:hypothetical protein